MHRNRNRIVNKIWLGVLFLACAMAVLGARPSSVLAQQVPEAAVVVAPVAPAAEERPWYDRLRIRGYMQFRYNRLPTFDSNDKLVSEQGDRSIGMNNGFFLRRARVILFGDVHPRVSIYIQPDLASSIGDQLHVAILRDLYADLFLDADKEFRLRVGQSKVPFGFENLQSSQNRVPLDRNEAINSALKDERDIGVFFYWAPSHIRKRFKALVDSGLKGSGDYGVFGFGVYNGQTANRPERNDNRHVVARLTWPFQLRGQFIETSLQGYRGRFHVRPTAAADGTTYTLGGGNPNLVDERVAGSLVFYPQPFGFQAEYNIGRGPALGQNQRTTIRSRPLQGGYAQAMYKLDTAGQTIIPYVRGTLYEGGKKFDPNAPRYEIKELETGVEWQFSKALEVVAAYMISDRTSSVYPYLQQQGHVTRVQVQVNY